MRTRKGWKPEGVKVCLKGRKLLAMKHDKGEGNDNLKHDKGEGNDNLKYDEGEGNDSLMKHENE